MLSVTAAICQKERFDIAAFTAPAGWKRIDTAGTVSFFDSRTENGRTQFCQIILYPSGTSAGNAARDFETAWNNLVAVPTGTRGKPATQTTLADGWTVVTGAGNVKRGQLTYKTIVVNATGFGKSMPVQVNTAGGDYTATIEKFFAEFDLDGNAASQPVNPSTANTATTNMNDYVFTPPAGWNRRDYKDFIELQNGQSGCQIRILPPQPLSGNLERDARSVFETMYAGWQYQKSGMQQYILSKGRLTKGLEFCMMEAPMSMTASDGRYHIEEGVSLVVRANNQIVIISARHNSSLLAHDDCRLNYASWRRFFNSFTVKNIPASPPVANDPSTAILGAWTQTESGASSEYVFAANGNYARVGALGSKYVFADIRYEYLHLRTYAFTGDGSYTIAGNQLTLSNKQGKPEVIQIRFEKANHGGAGWKDRVWMLKKDDYGERESCYEKKN